MGKYAALLISRQNLRPSRSSSWVKKTVEAVGWVRENGYSLLTSVGMLTWEMQLALASIFKVSQLIIVPTEKGSDESTVVDEIIRQFDLDRKLIDFKFIAESDKTKSRLLRDRVIVEKADLLIPISLRPEGILSGLLTEAELDGKKINRDFQTRYKKESNRIAYKLDEDHINRNALNLKNNFLIHWTRASNRPWPDESAINFYCDILASPLYPRSAFETLSHIIEKGRIVASTRHMPANIPTVSFSALNPIQALKLMRYRSRYREMTFEPYGIGISLTAAERLGVQPVVYYDKKKGRPRETSLWLTQSKGVRTNWSDEKEFRSLGDFLLNSIKSEDLILFTKTKEEADLLSKQTGLNTASILK